jgi:hypothetical protein
MKKKRLRNVWSKLNCGLKKLNLRLERKDHFTSIKQKSMSSSSRKELAVDSRPRNDDEQQFGE